MRTIHKPYWKRVLHPIPEHLIALNRQKVGKKKNIRTEKDNLGIKTDFNLIQAPIGPIYFIKQFMQANGITEPLTALEAPNKLTSEN